MISTKRISNRFWSKYFFFKEIILKTKMQTEVKPQENSIRSKINFEFMNRSFSIQTKHLEKK